MSVPMPVAACLVCGDAMTLLEAPLHIEDHQARGELPSHFHGPGCDPSTGVCDTR